MKSPFFTSYILKREVLSKKGSEKEVFHIELQRDKHSLPFQVGDSLGVYPQNDPLIVRKIVNLLDLTGNEFIQDPRKKDFLSLHSFLQERVNLTRVTPSFCAICTKGMKPEKKALLEGQQKDFLIPYLEQYEVHDFLEEHMKEPPKIEALLPCFLKQLPRFYSIASCPDTHPKTIDLMIRHVSYPKGTLIRQGIASHFLCKTAEVQKTPLSIFILRSRHFSLPPAQKDIIMIGPGTGVAPFRAFLQQRIFQKASGKNWLFFGEQKKELHFYYQDFFSQCEKEKQLHLSTAFSRDQEEKFYVQHGLLQEEKTVFSWIENGAYIYICGDAKKMAKEVEKTLITILSKQKNIKEELAKEDLQKLKEEKRLLLDVY